MTILCDMHIAELLGKGLVEKPNWDHLNPASFDICVGKTAKREISHGRFEDVEIPDTGLVVEPGDFLLVGTAEWFNVPNGYALDLRLKSSTARKGWNHALAVWVDPGWQGIITMELSNSLAYNSLRLIPGQRFAQALVHKLSAPSQKPYAGRYQGAKGVETAKI